MPQLLYLQERPSTHCIGGWVGPGSVWTGAENLAPTEIQILYNVKYPVSKRQLCYIFYTTTNQVDQNHSWGVDSWSRNAPTFMESTVHTSFPGLPPEPEKYPYLLLNIMLSGLSFKREVVVNQLCILLSCLRVGEKMFTLCSLWVLCCQLIGRIFQI
jgi:hypothetical protein